MNNNRLDCAIVRDLLSLYHDQVVSDTTKEAVAEHLEGCEACREEYSALCRELPSPVTELSTGKRFASMMKRQKTGRIISIVLPILLAVAILVTGYVVQLYHPLTDMNGEITVPQVFRYETTEGTKFFFLFERPMYEGTLSGEAHTEYTKDGAVLQIDFERPILVTTIGDKPALDLFVYEFSGLPGTAPSCAEVTEVRLGSSVIWSEEENGGDQVPAYVYEYDRFGIDDSILTWDVDYDADDPSLCRMTAEYADGHTVVWDFEGNVTNVFDSADSENTSISEYNQ